MGSQEDDSTGLVMGVIFGVIALVLSLIIGLSIYQKNKTAKTQSALSVASGAPAAGAGSAAGAAAVAMTSLATGAVAAVGGNAAPGGAQAAGSSAAEAAALAAAGKASIAVENGVVKFFFASGKFDLAAGGTQALSNIIVGVQAGKKAVISGYVDSTGSPEQNKEIAKQRAFAVRDLLKASGLTDAQIELKKPEDIQAGAGAQARRVEVVLQ
jgi:outer membrane protein OmpA-like peptidoglycan-associated protein